MSTELLSDYDAIGVLDGFVTCEDAEMYLRACKTIAARLHLRGILCGSGTQQALEVAAYAAKHGDDAALEALALKGKRLLT
jgi:sRNA-binding protein